MNFDGVHLSKKGFLKLLDAILLNAGPRPPLRPIISGEDGPISNFNKGVAGRRPHYFKIEKVLT